jgi:PhoD-like phosphatase
MTAPRLTVVGHCTSVTARILCCADRGAAASPRVGRLAWRASGKTGFVDVSLAPAPPYEVGVFEVGNLPGSAEVTYGIVIGDDPASLPAADRILETAGLHRFRLLPKHRPPRVALVSCNGAFEVKDERTRYDMWRSLRREIEAGNVDLIIHCGDQVYADKLVSRNTRMARAAKDQHAAVKKLSEEYRRLYIEQSWNMPDVAAVLTSCPSIMMWDDHDIDDGWGSRAHDEKPWRQLFFAAARRAFTEFQASLNPPGVDASSFACGFVHGNLAFLLLDGRSHRVYKEGRILGTAQLEAARKWLEALPATIRRVYLVLGIPPIHAKLSTIVVVLKWVPIREDYAADLRDAWVSRHNRSECAELMKVLFDFCDTHPRTDLTILSGDVHVANIGKMERNRAAGEAGEGDQRSAVVWQVTSSGIGSPPPDGVAGWLMEKVTREPVDLGAGVHGNLIPITLHQNDLMNRRNFALLKLDDGDAWHREDTLRVSLFGEALQEPLAFMLPGRARAQ